MVAGLPDRGAAVPASVSRVADGRALRVVWHNEVGGLTFEVGHAPDHFFVKWVPRTSGIDLDAETARLTWASGFTPVPSVLDHGRDATGSWIALSALKGENAVSARWRADPATAVDALGRGLRALHDALPLESCPFSWSATDRLEDARQRAAAGRIDPGRWHEDHQPLDVIQALELAAQTPSVDKLVVCHGDACAPNTLLTDDGEWSGHVDLGALGVADRWADLAVATWSATWNYGSGWETPLLDAYGITTDPDRTRYYRLLWDLDP